jgi:mono/diheme cytochrome c family protein
MRSLCGAVAVSMLVAGTHLHAQQNAMELVPAPDEHARTHSTAVHHLSKAATTYAANCSGCHGQSGRSVGEIPTLVDRIGYFARIPEGRAYLVQVPNVAMSAIRDEDLADMLNWLLETYSAAQLPRDFRAYSGAEVSELRKIRIVPWVRRKELIQALLAARQIPSADTLE